MFENTTKGVGNEKKKKKAGGASDVMQAINYWQDTPLFDSRQIMILVAIEFEEHFFGSDHKNIRKHLPHSFNKITSLHFLRGLLKPFCSLLYKMAIMCESPSHPFCILKVTQDVGCIMTRRPLQKNEVAISNL